MRKTESSHLTPLMRISLLLTPGIVMGKFCYGSIDTIYWLVASLLAWGLSFLWYKRDSALQYFAIYLCIAFSGALLTSRQLDFEQETLHAITAEELSPLDRTILNAQVFRNKVAKEMQNLNLTNQDFAVVTAMTIGDKSALSKETKDIYSISGASHVLAVSGLHIGIIFQLFILVLGGRRRSPITVLFSLIAIWAYVLFIGMPASAVRSAMMISICSLALLAHKDAISINNLCIAYVVMLLFRPLYLFDISFQMSFLAVFSILLFTPFIQKIYRPSGKVMKYIWGMFCMSLAAQIGTMPLIVYYFGRISCYSLLTGFIAIPAATLILYLSALAMLFTLLGAIPYISLLTTPLLHFSASCLVSITQACNTALQLSTLLPFACIDGIQLNIPQLCLIYLSIVMGYLLLRKFCYSNTSSIPFP